MTIQRASDNPFPSILFEEHVDPATPPSGHWRLWVDTDNTFKVIDDAGTVTSLGGSGLSDPMTTRGDIIVRDASNVTARLAIGSAGKVLSSDGTDVSWQTPSSVVWTRLDEKIASGGSTASFDFTSISAAYRTLVIHFAMRGTQSAATATLHARFNNDSGSNYSITRGYSTGSGGAFTTDSFDNKTSFENIIEMVGATGTSSVATYGEIIVPHYYNTNWHKMIEARASGWTSTSSTTFVRNVVQHAGKWASTAAVSRITLTPGTGNIADNSIATLYGIA